MSKKRRGAKALTPDEFEARNPAESAAADKQLERHRLKRAQEAAQEAEEALLQAARAQDAEAVSDLLAPYAQTVPATGLFGRLIEVVQGLRSRRDMADPRLRMRRMSKMYQTMRPRKKVRIPYREARAQAPGWVIPGWLPERKVGILTAPGGKGKTMLTLQLAYALTGAGGWKRLGLPRPDRVEPARVVYAGYEDESVEIVTRLDWLDKALSEDDPSRPRRDIQPDNLAIIDETELQSAGPLWGRSPDGRPLSIGERLEGWYAVMDDPDAQVADLLIIDPLNFAFLGSEIDRAEVSAFLGALGSWARECQTAVLIMSHPPKDRQGSGRNSVSGSTAWTGALRFAWTLADLPAPAGVKVADWEAPDWLAMLRSVKRNKGPRPADIPLRMDDNGIWEVITAEQMDAEVQALTANPEKADRERDWSSDTQSHCDTTRVVPAAQNGFSDFENLG